MIPKTIFQLSAVFVPMSILFACGSGSTPTQAELDLAAPPLQKNAGALPPPAVPKVFKEVSDNGRDDPDFEVFSCIEEWSAADCTGEVTAIHGDICVIPTQPDTARATGPAIREAYTKNGAVDCGKNECCEDWTRTPPADCATICEAAHGPNCVIKECQQDQNACGTNKPSARCVCEQCD
jgi:hypothetical protein